MLDNIIVTAAAVLGMAFTAWFFLGKRERAVKAAHNEITIVVDGGYTPDTIELERGKKARITFVRKDPNPCLEEVVISEFSIRKYLPLNQSVSIEIEPHAAGRFGFACGMNMYHGTIIVR